MCPTIRKIVPLVFIYLFFMGLCDKNIMNPLLCPNNVNQNIYQYAESKVFCIYNFHKMLKGFWEMELQRGMNCALGMK